METDQAHLNHISHDKDPQILRQKNLNLNLNYFNTLECNQATETSLIIINN